MLSLDDDRWDNLTGGYRMKYDPRPLLSKLENGRDTKATWHELWDELHHQGDVGEASYAAVPHLVRIHRKRRVVDWNTYALVATIELARGRGGNPEVPSWLKEVYEETLHDLAEIGLTELSQAEGPEATRCILS